LRRRAQGEDLGVGRGVVGADGAVAGSRDDLAGGGIDDQRAHGRLAPLGGGLRLAKGDAH